MTKFTKISAAALFALFLTACDKPADKTTEVAKAETTPVAQPASEVSKAEEMVVNAEKQGEEDFKKMFDWNNAQEQALASFQTELEQKLASGDKAKVEEALKTFTVKVNEVLASLDKLEIKDALVLDFKKKTKETLMLSNELIADSVKAMANPTEEMQKVIQEKSQTLIQSGTELQKLQIELQQKYAK